MKLPMAISNQPNRFHCQLHTPAAAASCLPHTLSPCLIAVAAVEAHDDFVLLPRPRPALDVGVQVVVPPAGGAGKPIDYCYLAAVHAWRRHWGRRNGLMLEVCRPCHAAGRLAANTLPKIAAGPAASAKSVSKPPLLAASQPPIPSHPAHRSRHCLPMRPGRCSAIMVHFWGP